MNESFVIVNSGSYAVGWFTLALINAGLAQGKNRRGLVWFLLSLLLGPIATLILVLLDKGRRL
ncbi:MAG TPA: antitermination protein NusB [Cellvibrionaceae bacterium]